MKSKWLIRSVICIFILMILVFFTISAFLLIMGLFGWILKDGTFDFFHYSVSQTKDTLLSSKKEEAIRSQENQMHRLSRAIPSFYLSLVKAGTLFLVCSILCTIIYYLIDS